MLLIKKRCSKNNSGFKAAAIFHELALHFRAKN